METVNHSCSANNREIVGTPGNMLRDSAIEIVVVTYSSVMKTNKKIFMFVLIAYMESIVSCPNFPYLPDIVVCDKYTQKMDSEIQEYNERLAERLKLTKKDIKEDREAFLRDDTEEVKRAVKYTPKSNSYVELERIKSELRQKRVNPATLYSLYNRNNFPKKKLLYDSDGTSYYPLDGFDLYAFKMKRGRMQLPYGETVLYRSKRDTVNAYISKAVLGICEGNKSIVSEYADAKPSIVCGTLDIVFI